MRTHRTLDPTTIARSIVAVALCSLAPAAVAQDRINFVSCPIVRDTATVPCWLTEYDGELYYMGIQTDVSAEFQPPYLGHQVLVEATVAASEPRICGGVVLDPIRISVMPELDRSCNTMLPAVPEYTIDFNPRPPGPSGGRLAFAPAPNAAPEPAPAPAPELPSGPRAFAVYFDVDQGIGFRHPGDVLRAYNYANQIAARRITVRATRGSTLLTNGDLVTESAGVAQRRAEQIADLLRGLGVEAEIGTEFSTVPASADGIDDWQSRSVEILVEP
jgi:hypothetical protein